VKKPVVLDMEKKNCSLRAAEKTAVSITLIICVTLVVLENDKRASKYLINKGKFIDFLNGKMTEQKNAL